MELNTDTIAAVSTAPGVGGIAVIRISGPQALPIFAQIWKGKGLNDAQTHTAHFGTIADSLGRQIDECVATLFRAPKSFTGEDTVRFPATARNSSSVKSCMPSSAQGHALQNRENSPAGLSSTDEWISPKPKE